MTWGDGKLARRQAAWIRRGLITALYDLLSDLLLVFVYIRFSFKWSYTPGGGMHYGFTHGIHQDWVSVSGAHDLSHS
jgi:hypothetical protein